MPTREQIIIDELLNRFPRMSRQEWEEARYNYIGGSDISAVLGCNPWTSAVKLYDDKKEKKPFRRNTILRRGQFLEPLVVEEYEISAHRRDEDIVIFDTTDRLFVCNEFSYLCASLDRIAIRNGQIRIMEAKSACGEGCYKWYDGVPQYVMLQCQQYLFVIRELVREIDPDYPIGDIKVDLGWLLNDNPYELLDIDLDLPSVCSIVEAGKVFWSECILTNTPPAPRTLDDFKRIYRDATIGTHFDAPDEFMELLLDRKAIRASLGERDAAVDTLKEKLDEVETGIRAFFKDYEYATYNGEIIASYKNINSKKKERRLYVYEKLLKEVE